MSDQKWFNSVALALAVTVVVGFLLGMGFASNPSSTAPPAPTRTVDHLYLTIAYNPSSGMDEYFPANLTLPAHTLVIVTITNYDNGTNPVPAGFAGVSGTNDGSEQVWFSGAASPRSLTALPNDQVGHTFTIMQGPSSMMMAGPYHLNAVIPPATSSKEPTTVVFGAYFNTTGTFTWICLAPCDMGAMGTPGLMTGSVTVSD